MLVNSDVEWLRTQNGVPQGSGDISGVIVNTENGYFQNAELLGRYQIRPMGLDDIALGDTGFSEKVVEWYWPAGKGTEGSNDGAATWNASFGEGKFTSTSGKINQSSALLETSENNDHKAIRWQKALLWDAANNAPGAEIKMSFSTKSVAGKKLVLIFSAAVGPQDEKQYPVNWNISYRIGDNVSTPLQKVLIRPLPKSSSTGMKAPLALDEFYIELPDALIGQDSVSISFQAADGVAFDFTKGDYSAKVTAKEQDFRFGAVVVKSIK